MQFVRKLGLALVLGWALTASAEEPQPDTAPSLVLKNATLHTLTGDAPYVGTVVIEAGIIKAVGANIESPDGAEVVDLTGYHLYPGLIESRGKLWMTPAAIAESNDKAELNVVDALDPWSEDWRELAAQGITSVYTQPNSASKLGGYGALLRVGPHGGDAIVIRDRVALQASIGITGATSRDRHAQVEALGKLLESAKEKPKDDSKQEQAEEEDAAKADDESEEDAGGDEGEENEEEGDSEKEDSGEGDSKDKVDPTKAALRRVLNREIPLHVEVHHSDSLLKIIELADKYEIRVVLDGLSHVESQAGRVLESGFPVVVGPLFESGEPPTYRQSADFSWLGEASRADALWALGSFSNQPRASQWLRVQAAAAIAAGADSESTLLALTLNPARLLGVEEQLGTIVAGKMADLVAFGGSPTDPSAPTRLTVSHGVVTFDNPDARSGALVSTSVDPEELPTRLPNEYAIRSARILIDGAFQSGTLLVRDGVVVSFAPDLDPGDIEVFDLGEAVVTPGLVSAHSTLGQEQSIVDATEPDSSQLRAVDGVDPLNPVGQKMLAGGFVHVGISPGFANPSSGVIGHLRLGARPFVAEPAIASQFILSASARQPERFPVSLNGQRALLEQLLAGKPAVSPWYVNAEVLQSLADAKRANLTAATDGSRRSVLLADTRLEMLAALELADQFDLAATIRSQGDVGELAAELADAKVGLIVVNLDGNEYLPQLTQWATVANAGVPLAFAGDSAEKIRATAALLVQAGVAPEVALRGLTGGGADLVGMTSTELAAGNPADLVVWTGSPLDPGSRPVTVIVDGQPVSKK